MALNELEGKVLTIRDQLEQARITIETSGYRDIVSTTDKNSLDTYKLNINTAYSNLLTAKADIALAKANADDAINSARSTVFNLENQLDVSQNGLYEAQVKEARAKVQLLMEQIRDVTLKSPVDGKVVRVNKKAGETAQAGSLDPVVSVLPLIPFEVDADIYEEDVVLVSVGNNVDIYLIPFPEKIFKGKVVSIDPAEKAIEGVIYYEVNIAFEEEIPESLKPGMTADVNIKTGTKQDVIIIPEDAITRHNGKSTVNVSKNGRIQEREVILGLEGTDGMVEIISGLQVGEKVVIEQ
ncbi:MAG: hypothetical protein US98_C0013G0012 [Parcubacteria group bacterium GW2011_GWC1_38_6]|nr:MAG: hypothetical protein US98_C0013G0012 [Parcubacteria group bacterium GW2011_GWC1_38_6]